LWRHGEDSDDDGDCNDKEVHADAYGIDTNYYSDMGATDHITGALTKLTVHDKYQGRGCVHTTDGNSMHISYIGHSIFHTPSSPLHLKNVLHVPSASKNMLSVHKITLDNDVLFEFHPYFFLIKDQTTRRIMFKGPYHGGVYPLVPFSIGSASFQHYKVVILYMAPPPRTSILLCSAKNH
jgi:hypothetical protein